jgi:arginase
MNKFMQNKNDIYLLGYASSIGGPDPVAGEGPLFLEKSPYLFALKDRGVNLQWHAMIVPDYSVPNKLDVIFHDNKMLAENIAALTVKNKFFMVLGGDHTCAIGTWSGAAYSLRDQGSLGLIWIDAHMDSHTPETSLTGNYHGMPLACLLGYGDPQLTNIMMKTPKLKPENLCLIGIRSFEKEEELLLQRLNVRIYYMDEVKNRGLDVVLQEALAIVTRDTVGFGISLDIDSIDPIDAPATDVSEPGGLRAKELCTALQRITHDPRLLGVEITEFDPHRDIEQKTEKLIPELIFAMTGPSVTH